MNNIILTLLFTIVLFVLSGFALAFVYNNKRNQRCLMCGFKSENSCVKTVCPKRN
jgi:hypothetical protein